MQLQTKGDNPTTIMAGPVPLLQSLKEMLFFRTKQQNDHDLYPVPSHPHAVPLHRALSCALVTVNPASLEEEDELTGLRAFQLAAVRKGDLDSSYYLLHLSTHGCW